MHHMIPQCFCLRPKSIRTRFAYRFLRALKKLNNHCRRTTSTSTTKEATRRYIMVKTAAYTSMASAVGSKRAWSRAMLWKIRNRAVRRSFVKRTKSRALKKRRVKEENPSKEFGFEELRKLVPGGDAMDLCSLLDETAHYMKCLTSQVQVMRNIVDFYSASI